MGESTTTATAAVGWKAFCREPGESYSVLAILEIIAFAGFGIYVCVVSDIALPFLCGVALFSIFGMVVVHNPKRDHERIYGRKTTLLAFLLALIAAVAIPFIWIDEVREIGKVLGINRLKASETKPLFAIAPFVAAFFYVLVSIGLLYYTLRIRVFFYFIASKSNHRVETLCRVWSDRQFKTDLTSRLEILPGYAFSDFAIALDRKHDFHNWIRVLLLAFFGVMSIIARVAFKAGFFLTAPLVYLASPLRFKRGELQTSIIEHKKSRLNFFWIAISLLVIGLTAGKIIFSPILVELLEPYKAEFVYYHIAPSRFPLWQLVSLVNAILMIATTWLVDRLYVSITLPSGPEVASSTTLLTTFAALLMRIRFVGVIYVWFCVALLGIPIARELTLPFIDWTVLPSLR